MKTMIMEIADIEVISKENFTATDSSNIFIDGDRVAVQVDMDRVVLFTPVKSAKEDQ